MVIVSMIYIKLHVSNCTRSHCWVYTECFVQGLFHTKCDGYVFDTNKRRDFLSYTVLLFIRF